MFSNAKSVEINGKEVKSIILENGAILYEKEYPYVLSVSSNKDILSYADQDSATLTASLTKGGVPVEGKEVKFYIMEDVPAGLSFTGNNFTISSSSSGLSGNNIVIDWGDGSTTTYTGVSSLNHTYSEAGDYFITITGVTSLRGYCFHNCSGLTSVVIPEGVTSIEPACFRDCSGLTNVVIPEGVTNLEDYCFYGCSSLTSIVIPEGVTSIGNSCFWKCSSLTSVVIPEGVTSIGPACFEYCSGLTSVAIPKGVTSIGSSCFWNCSSLTSVVIPEGVTNLEDYCFHGCSSLTSIVIPEGVTNIKSHCFSGCSGLTSIVIPEGVTSLGEYCFYSCYNLTSVVIPESVTSLGESCFQYCSYLTSLICNWTTNPPTFNSTWIANVPSLLKFSIPKGTTQVYIDAGYPSDKLVERSE